MKNIDAQSLIGEIMNWLGYVSEEQVNAAMAIQNAERQTITAEQSAAGVRPRLIGAILVAQGHATEHQVDHAFRLQQILRGKSDQLSAKSLIGQILVFLEFASEDQIDKAFALQTLLRSAQPPAQP